MTFGSLTARAPVGAETPGSVFVQQVERNWIGFVDLNVWRPLATVTRGRRRVTSWTSDDRGPCVNGAASQSMPECLLQESGTRDSGENRPRILLIADSFKNLEKRSEMLESDRSRRGSVVDESGRELDFVS
ncbi:uncharacterized protein PgNI_04650 [Pyricularia grisea]|uniref:Uncharacterized protein n=1 Tax=Pyricularia grisea TaxID=148305 RepID=A0A6P8BD43_PYRGI|nr:uncharacterized protein PgNI_04650 [Pyricularia grisea]TLD13796.1 hypothetical protein PgNI_04650 [Pyricularia grisea]